MKIILFCLAGLVLGAGGMLLFSSGITDGRTAYVYNDKLFREFRMTKELERSLKETQTVRAKVLDSLMTEIRTLNQIKKSGNSKATEALTQKEQEFTAMQDEFAKQEEAQTQNYNTQIWNQINSYLREYGEKNSYRYIFGANGDGTLIYADKGKDITDDVMKFINDRYDGK